MTTTHYRILARPPRGNPVYFDGCGWSTLPCNALTYASLPQALSRAARVANLDWLTVEVTDPAGAGIIVTPRR